MTAERSGGESVVLLVDSKTRDLDIAALVASHLRSLGIVCHLEPLEAFRAVLAAYRPGMIVFNHLTAGHLVAWSKRLAEMGVLSAVLPNEGIAYDPDDLRYLAGKFHSDAHVDYIFAWNEPYRQAVLAEVPDAGTRVHVVGVPRFDFYFEPWSRLLNRPEVSRSGRPRVLFCTNFVTARFSELPAEAGDRFFAPWAGRIPLYANYRQAIDAHWRARARSLDYLTALLKADQFEVVLRPHPTEDRSFYTNWIEALPADLRRYLRFDPTSPISSLILDCDLEISCETCTTALESWIAGKPTVELIFERNPLWYREEHARCNIECDRPEALPEIVARELSNPAQPEKRELRRRHLETWCASPDGGSSLKLAEAIAAALAEKKPANWSLLDFNDWRRALKLLIYRKLGLAYHFDPLLWLKRLILGDKYAIKKYAYEKSIKPRDVLVSARRFERLR